MKSYKQMVNEVLTKSTPAGEWIDDFVHSDNPKFAGKSAAKRKQMALAAYYAKKNESVEEAAAVSQNSTAMQDMNEDHLVHVNDGSKYDEQPHEKDVEHVMAGVKLHGGEHAGASDKGVFFKFKSPEHASSFISHVNKCPHRSCDAHMSEAVEYKGIGTDVVDKKKKLNPQPNFTTDKKQVKDFKEEAEPIDELSKGLVARYANKAAKTTQANYDKSKDKFQFSSGRQDGMKNAVKRLTKEEAEQIDELDKKTIGSYAKKATKDLKWQQTMRPFDAKRISNREKGIDRAIDKLTKEEVELIDELSKDTLASYAKKASHDARIKQHVAADFKSKKAHARNPRKKETWDSIAKKYQSQAWKREKGHDKAVDKLAKEEVQIDESSLHRQHFQMVADLIRGHESAEKRKELAHHHAELFKKANPRFDHAKFMKAAGVNEEVELIAKHEVKADAPHKTSGHVILTKSSDKWHVLHNKKSSPDAKDLHRSKLLHSYDNEKEARAKFKELHEEQIDEVSKSTLMRYIPAAARAAAQHTYSGKEAQAWAGHHMRAGDYAASDRQLATSKSEFGKSLKRIKGVDTATKKLGTKKTYEQFVHGLELDESKGLPHALVQAGKSKWHIYDTKTREVHSTYNNKNVAMKKYGELNDKHAGYDSPGGLVRSKYGVRQEPMRKEEVELDEAIAKKLPVQHAVDAVHATLGPKSATRFLSHLSPGSEKHTSWDKVNDALVKQGVQTHHIAKIAQHTSHMNEAYTDKEYQSAIAAYLKKGGKVETLPIRKPRPSEKTFINRTGSIWKKGYTKSAVSGFNNKSQTTVDDRNKHIREEAVEESRGHKVLATFFKNREVAQRAYQGNPARDSEVAAGGGSPAEQGIAAAKRDAQELKKKVAESRTPAVHAALPKKTKSTAKEYDKASIPGTKRITRAKSDDNEIGGGTATRVNEDQYTSEYKIKSFVDPITGENKTRKIRPHRINFKSSKMNAAPAQETEPTKVTEGYDDYSSIAKELIKRHGKNVTAQHVKDFAGERDSNKGLDHAEVMHHVKKLSEDDKVYDEKWKKVKFTDFIKGAK